MSRTLRRGFSDEIGSWKIICICGRSLRTSSPVERGDLLSVEDDAAARRVGQLHDRSTGRRLAAARLADEPERLARQHVEADARDRVHPQAGVAERELDDELLDAQEGVGGVAEVGGAGAGHLCLRRRRRRRAAGAAASAQLAARSPASAAWFRASASAPSGCPPGTNTRTGALVSRPPAAGAPPRGTGLARTGSVG